MAELALRTTEFKNQKAKYLAWRPVGSVIISISEHQKRLKWIEIMCDLVSPKKRDSYKNLPGYKYLIEHWTQELRDRWLEADRPTEKYPIGRLKVDSVFAQSFWETEADSQLFDLLGKDPRGEVDVTNTWLWSEAERKRYFIVTNEDEVDSITASWQGFNETLDEGKLIIHPKAQIKYKTEAEISQDTLTAIADPEVIVHPKFSSPLSKVLVSTPSVLELSK